MSRRFRLVSVLLLVAACSLVRGEDTRHVVVVCIDGLAANLLDDPKAPLPTIRRLAREGSVAEQGMRVSNPSVTWPNHTTLMTGVRPEKHGVLANGVLVRGAIDVPVFVDPKRDQRDLVRVPTLVDAAHETGLTTAEVNWPCTRGSKSLDDSFPDVPDAVTHMTPRLRKELVAKGILLDETQASFAANSVVGRDLIWTETACHLLKERKPNLLLVHLLNVDSTHHLLGPQTPAGYTANAYADACLGRIVAAIDEAGLREHTTLIVLADHGFTTTPKAVRPNVLLRQEKLLTVTAGKIQDARIHVIPEGGTGLVYCTNPGVADEDRKRIKKLFLDKEGVADVLLPEQFAEHGLPVPREYKQAPDAVLVTKDGYAVSGAVEGEEFVAINTEAKTSLGSHGFLATLTKMNAPLVLSGRGIRRGEKLQNVENIDVAPTIAKLLGLDGFAADGQLLSRAIVASSASPHDHLRKLQTIATQQNHATWGHWGPDAAKYSSWTSHSNRLIPLYSYGIDLSSVKGPRSAYRDAERLKGVFGFLPEDTLNPDAEYFDQTDVFRLQKLAVDQGKKCIVLVVFDGMDWQTTRAAAIKRSGKIGYESGRGTGLYFQDYSRTKTDFGYYVTAPHNEGTKVNVDTQTITNPGGNLRGGYDWRSAGATPWDKNPDSGYPLVPTNAMVKDIAELGNIPLRQGTGPSVYLRDLATIEDAADLTTGYALVNGRRAVYILATKRADASTMSVIDEIKSALPKMQAELPDDIRVSFEFDQSPYVTRAITSLVTEGILGAILTGLMVLLFLRDWRSALVVVLNIPLAIMTSIVGLWITGNTINLMTLGGLALAVGILVDEATVEIENIHSQMRHTDSIAWAVRLGNAQTAIPRLLAMLCVLAVFVPSFFMEGAARGLFVPLALAVGFSMIASYILSSTFVPVVSTWLLRHVAHEHREAPSTNKQPRRSWRDRYQSLAANLVRLRWLVVPAYLIVCLATIGLLGPRLGVEIFPTIDAGEFRLRMRAPDGTHIERTEQMALQSLDVVKELVGPENVDLTLGYVGTIPPSFPINAVYQWQRGPEEAILRIALKHNSGISTEGMKEQLRDELAKRVPQARFSFEPADIVSEVMSFGSATPIEVAVRGGSLAENRDFMGRVQRDLKDLPGLRDVQISQSLDYPTVQVQVNREKAGKSETTASQITRSVVAATSSSRFVVPNYWPDPKTGIGYQVQVEIPQPRMASIGDLERLPVRKSGDHPLLLRDVAEVKASTMPGQFDRYNMKRELTLTANLSQIDLGKAMREVSSAIDGVVREYERDRQEKIAKGEKPAAVTAELRGQIPPLRQMMSGLGVGLALAVLVIFLLLSANFQSWKLAFATISTTPAVISGVVIALWITGSTLNIQSFIGAIMGIGVAMANAILLITFAEQTRRAGVNAREAAAQGAASRLRAILMTSFAMTAGMVPMALALGEAGPQTAPLGRAVIGGLLAATLATLLVLPAVFAIVQGRAHTRSPSLDPADPESSLHSPAPAEFGHE
jgi:multidrug efflux pump subunit AcrB/predicted AlkP superfamily pyrophosphatase or phosphodiesterase